MSIIKDTLEWLSAVDKPCETKEELKVKFSLVKNLVEEELSEFEEACLSGDSKGMLNAVVDVQWMLNNLTFFAGFTEEEVEVESRIVRETNFTKFCLNEAEAIEAVKAYLSGTHPNKLGEVIQAEYFATGNLKYPYVVKRIDGKLLKPTRYVDK